MFKEVARETGCDLFDWKGASNHTMKLVQPNVACTSSFTESLEDLFTLQSVVRPTNCDYTAREVMKSGKIKLVS